MGGGGMLAVGRWDTSGIIIVVDASVVAGRKMRIGFANFAMMHGIEGEGQIKNWRGEILGAWSDRITTQIFEVLEYNTKTCIYQ